MKKSLIALALIGTFSGAAVAQSNVTLYGILDVNYMWQEGPTNVGTSTAPRIEQESVSAINSGHQSGSRWGLRGSEALGGGLSAIFALEGGYDIDRGTQGQGGRLFGRQAYAGLSGGWGSVVAGRLATFSSGTGDFDMIGRVDPFATGFGLASAGSTFISMNALRVDNTVAYVSPTMAGFKAGVGYSTRIDGAEVAPSEQQRARDAVRCQLVERSLLRGRDVRRREQRRAAPRTRSTSRSAARSTSLPSACTPGGPTSRTSPPSPRERAEPVRSSRCRPASRTSTRPPGCSAPPGRSARRSRCSARTRRSTRTARRLARSTSSRTTTSWRIGATYNLSRRTNLYTSWASRDSDGTLVGNAADALAVRGRHPSPVLSKKNSQL